MEKKHELFQIKQDLKLLSANNSIPSCIFQDRRQARKCFIALTAIVMEKYLTVLIIDIGGECIFIRWFLLTVSGSQVVYTHTENRKDIDCHL